MKLTKPVNYEIINNKPYSLQQVAIRLGISVEAVRRLVLNKQITAFKPGCRILIMGYEIINYREANKI